MSARLGASVKPSVAPPPPSSLSAKAVKSASPRALDATTSDSPAAIAPSAAASAPATKAPLSRVGKSPAASASAGGAQASDGARVGESMAALLNYTRKADCPPLAGAAAKAMAHVLRNYNVPSTFEVDLARFGPLSGCTYTQRLLANWAAGTLDLKEGCQHIELCAACEGPHWKSNCPKLLEQQPLGRRSGIKGA
jgi:hypothetical protein